MEKVFTFINCFGELGAIVVLCWVSACLGGLGVSTALLRRVATNVAEHFAERDVKTGPDQWLVAPFQHKG